VDTALKSLWSLLIVCAALPAWAQGAGYTNAYSLTANCSLVSGTSNDFVALFTGASGFATIANGGHATNANGYDHIFSVSPSCSPALYYVEEPNSYVATSGALKDKIQVPVMACGTVIYGCVGNSSVTTYQGNCLTWDSNYLVSYYMGNGSLDATDSTCGANNGTLTGTTTYATGEIGGAMAVTNSAFNGITTPSLSFAEGETIEGWVNCAFSTYCGGSYGSIFGTSNYGGTNGIDFVPRAGSTAEDWSAGYALLMGHGYVPGNNPHGVGVMPTLTDNTWHHFIGVIGASTYFSMTQIYLDGSPLTMNVSDTAAIIPGSSTGDVGFNSGSNDKGTFSLDEVRVSNTIRTGSAPDIPAADDDFPGTTLNVKWVPFNSSGMTTTVSNGLTLVSASHTGSANYQGYYAPAPTPPYMITLEAALTATASNYYGASLLFNDGSSKMLAWGYAYTTTQNFEADYLSDPTTFSSTAYTLVDSDTTMCFRGYVDGVNITLSHYYSTTTAGCQIDFNPAHWVFDATLSCTAFLSACPSYFGIGVDSENGQPVQLVSNGIAGAGMPVSSWALTTFNNQSNPSSFWAVAAASGSHAGVGVLPMMMGR
jgi:hypothetical protein